MRSACACCRTSGPCVSYQYFWNCSRLKVGWRRRGKRSSNTAPPRPSGGSPPPLRIPAAGARARLQASGAIGEPAQEPTASGGGDGVQLGGVAAEIVQLPLAGLVLDVQMTARADAVVLRAEVQGGGAAPARARARRIGVQRLERRGAARRGRGDARAEERRV